METIYTIPINEAFAASSDNSTSGCPFCRLYEKMEENELDRILGAAMMEPDVRMETNEAGFCKRHFERMFKKKNRLGLALMLESHLDSVIEKASGKGIGALRGGPQAEAVRKLSALGDTCYLCTRIDTHMAHITENTVFLYESDAAFRKVFAAQPYFCLPHYRDLIDTATRKMNKRDFQRFYEVASHLENAALTSLRNDVSWFCKKFDYRYENEPWYNAKDAVERAIAMISGTKEDTK